MITLALVGLDASGFLSGPSPTEALPLPPVGGFLCLQIKNKFLLRDSDFPEYFLFESEDCRPTG